jgi:hypothetical protein
MGEAVIRAIEKRYKTAVAFGAQSFRVCDNLYVVLTSPHGAPSHCIEDCFDPAFLKAAVPGKTINHSNKPNGPNQISKAWFAEKVVIPNAKTIDFHGFQPLLNVIANVIGKHAP